jgi:hypothetical protein
MSLPFRGLKMDKTINILTRTSGRPNYFKENVESIESQTYPHINHIVCADDDESFEYASNLVSKVIRVRREEKRKEYGIMHSPYNLYCNTLMDGVEDGWIMFLDDDAVFNSNGVVDQIMSQDLNPNDVIIWKGDILGKIVPSYSYGRGVSLGDIDSFCFMFHSKHKWAAQWDEMKESDFRVVSKLSRLLNIKWVDAIVAKTNNDPSVHDAGVGYGDRRDKR